MNPAIVQAVLAAMQLSQPSVTHGCNETMGAIVQAVDGSLSSAVSRPLYRSNVHVEIAIVIPNGDKLVAIWHTHPACPATVTDTQFSPDDVAVQRQLAVPSFIYVQADRSIRVRYNGRVSIVGYNLL